MSVANVASALQAEQGGDPEAASRYMEAAWQAGIRFAEPMLAAARFFRRAGEIERAFALYLAAAEAGLDYRKELDREELQRHPTFQRGFAFAARKKPALAPLMHFKQALNATLPADYAFKVFNAIVPLPGSERLETRPVRSLRTAAAEDGVVYSETAPAGEHFTARPAHFIGQSNHADLACVTRSLYVACLEDARVRGRSGMIDFRGAALFDFEGAELERVDETFEFEPAVLRGSKEEVSIFASDTASFEVDEAFTLLGRHTPEFGHWIWEYLPKYVAATMSSSLSDLPILVDPRIPKNHRTLLDLVRPAKANVIEVPEFETVRVKRLWCAPTLSYVPTYLRSLNEFWPFYAVAPAKRFAPVIHEMWRRMSPAVTLVSGSPSRIFLARKPEQHRKLVNHRAIEGIAEEFGFAIVYPQDMDIIDQLQLIRNADRIVVPEGSGPFLGFFARPSTKMCILSPPFTLGLASYTSLLDAIGVGDVTVMTGSVAREVSPYPQFYDYAVPEDTFRAFLAEWTA